MMLDYVRIFADKADVINRLPDQAAGELLKGMLSYATTGTEPELKTEAYFVWPIFKDSIDQSAAASERNAANGKKGGATRAARAANADDGVATSSEREATSSECQATASDCQAISSNTTGYKKQETLKTAPDGADARAKARRFVPPTADEVRAYCLQAGITNVDEARFVDHYASKGWKVGKSSMADWRSAVRNWSRSENEHAATPPRASKVTTMHESQYSQREYANDDSVMDRFMAGFAAQ